MIYYICRITQKGGEKMYTERTFLIGCILFFIVILFIMLLIVIVADCCEKHDVKKEITEIGKKLRDLDESLQDIVDQLEPFRKLCKKELKNGKKEEMENAQKTKES